MMRAEIDKAALPFIPFQKEHLAQIDLNEFSNIDRFGHIFESADYLKYSLIDGDVKVIFCFRNYWGDNYEAFILASNTMRLKHGREFRDVMENGAKALNIKRIHTVSVACDKLDKWHEYLGFVCEGTHKNLMFNKDYRTWARSWE